VYQFEVEKDLQEKLYQSSVTDGLTGVFNKRYFLAKFESEFIRAARYDRTLSVIIFDFDDFKILNDTHGHMAGDMVLKIGSQLVRKIIRDADTLARFGGEEFVIILPETKLKHTRSIGEKIITAFRETTFETETTTIRATVSLGIAEKSKRTRTWKELLIKADKRLYTAKIKGKDQVCY